MNQSFCVAYILWRYPELTHTFVSSEILALRQAGVRVPVFSLLPARDKVRSLSSKAVCAQDTYYVRIISLRTVSSQILTIITDARAYLRAFSAVIDVFRMSRDFESVAKSLYLFPLCVSIGLMCKKLRVSHIHTHWPGLPVFSAKVVATICKVPFSFTIHTPQDAGSRGLEKQVSQASFIRCDTHLGQKLVKRRVPGMESKIRLIRSVNPCLWNGKSNADKGYFLTVARLIPMKGIIYLIQACASLKKRGLEFSCVIIGDGPLSANLKHEAASLGLEEKINFTGAVPHEQYIEYLANCSFLVMPSVSGPDDLEQTDGLPTVIIEAMSAGKPVVATPKAAIPEIVLDEQTGLLVPCKDVERLADALEKLIKNPKRRRELGMNALALSKQEFDHKVVSSQLFSLFYDHRSSTN